MFLSYTLWRILLYIIYKKLCHNEYNSHYEKLPNGEVRCIDDEIPFEIPSNWAWSRIKSIFFTTSGGTPVKGHPDYYIEGTIPWVKSGELRNKYIYHAETYITEEALKNSSAKYFPVDTVAVAMYGATIGKTSILKKELTTNQAICGIFPNPYIIPEYLYYFIQAKTSDYLSIAFGSGQPNISQDKIKETIMPIPPSAEQQKIVSILDGILEIVGKYSDAQIQLNKLNTEIYSNLKKSILQEAIQGRLVPQDKTEEPVSELLKPIKAEKQKLVKEGKLKAKDNADSIIYKGDDNKYYEKCGNIVTSIDDEIPFEIPHSWQWIRLQTVASIARGGSPRPIKDFLTTADNGVNWIKIGDTEKNGKYINATKEKIKPEGVSKSRLIHKGDFLLTNSMSFGRPYISNIEGCIHDGWLVISPFSNCYNQDFLFHLLSSQYAYQQFCGKVSGAVVQNLNSDKVAKALFPLPPLDEQQRIVSRLDDALASIMSR